MIKKNNFLIQNDILIDYTGNQRKVIIPNGIKEIGIRAFKDSNIEEIILPTNCEIIKEYAFENCKNLKNINLINIKRINDFAFRNCSSLEKIEFKKIEFIGNGSFSYTNLKEIDIEKKELDINLNSFLSCENLSKININTSLYTTKDGMIYNKDETELIYCPPNLKITEYKIPNNVKTLKANCFAYNKNIKSITLGENVETLNDFIFANSEIETIKFNNKLSNIESYVFYKTKIKNIDLSNTNIKEFDFKLSGIMNKDIQINRTIILPNNLENIILDPTEKISIRLNNITIKSNKTKKSYNQNIQEQLKYFDVEYEPTLEELIESGKSFKEANDIIKNQER